MTKQALRQFIRQQKAALSPSQRQAASAALCRNVEADPHFDEAHTILMYYPLPDEADVRSLLRSHPQKQFLLPVVVGTDLELRRYEGEASLAPGAFGILEPTGPAFDQLDAIDLVIVPGIAFTPTGQRLGRGRGYYDRLLPRLRNAYKMGVCWPCQMVTDIPTEPHDMPMDCVITG